MKAIGFPGHAPTHDERTKMVSTILALTILFTLQTPAPAPNQPFTLPLANGTTASAVILQGPAETLHLVYATKEGQLVFFTLTSHVNPIPPPPPTPTRIKIAIVEDPTRSTPMQRQVMADRKWRDHIPSPHTFHGVIPKNLIDPRTGVAPPEQAPFLKAATATLLPVLVFLDEKNKTVAVHALPDDAETILALIAKYESETHDHTNHRPTQLRNGHSRTSPTPATRSMAAYTGLLPA